MSYNLRYQNTTLIARALCIERMGPNALHADNVCTTNAFGKGICVGDEGSPLVQPEGNVLIGLASWSGLCGQGLPDVYVSVFSHLQFIQNAMEN